MRAIRLNIARVIAELRSELELIDVAIRALERFAHSIGVEEDDPTSQIGSRNKPVRRKSQSSDTRAAVMERPSEDESDETRSPDPLPRRDNGGKRTEAPGSSL
jgi:hypothetical protein